MLDHSQIAGLEIQELLLNKGINLYLSIKPHNDDRIINWCKLVRYFEKFNVFLKPEQIANILKQNDVEYSQLMNQLLVVIPSIVSLNKKEERFNKKYQLDFEQHAFIHNVKRIMRYGTKLKLPYLQDVPVLKSNDEVEIRASVDKSTHLSDTIKRYASQASIFEDKPQADVIIERKDSKNQNITSPFSQDQIKSLHDLMIREFKFLLNQKIEEFLNESSTDDSNLDILNEKTEFEAILAKKFKESEQVEQQWRDIEMDNEFEIKALLNDNIVPKIPIVISTGQDQNNINKAISEYFKSDLETSLKCLVYGCIEIAQFKGNNKSNPIVQLESANRLEDIVEHAPVLYKKMNLKSFRTFVGSSDYKILDLYNDLILKFNSLQQVQDKNATMCKIVIFSKLPIDSFASLNCFDFNSDFTIDKDILLFYNSPLNNHQQLQNKTIDLFLKFIKENLQFATNDVFNALEFYIYAPSTSNDIDTQIELAELKLHARFPIIQELPIVTLKTQTVPLAHLDLPLIDEFHSGNTNLT